MPLYLTLPEKVNACGKFLVAYDRATYNSVLGQLQARRKIYAEQKAGDNWPYHKNRRERLEALADALFEHLQYAPNRTIRFPLAKVQTEVGGKPAKKDIPAVFSTVTIEERSHGGFATYNFLIAYRKEGGIEYGYILPRVKC